MLHIRSSEIKETEKSTPVKKAYKFSKNSEIEAESEVKMLPPKTPTKRKQEEKFGNSDSKKMDWLKEKAKSSIIPEEKNAKLKPEFLFKESGPMIIHLCNFCKRFNERRQAETIEEGMIQIPLAMCSVCRHHFNQQRNLRFFQHELPTLKKDYQL